MKFSDRMLTCLFGLVTVIVMVTGGCGKGSNIAPVSGKLTLDGQPMPGVRIVFSPRSMGGENNNPGPYSFAVTDENGDYSLITRYKDEGAIIGPHVVTMQYPDAPPGTLERLKSLLGEAKRSNEGVAEVETAIADFEKKKKERLPIPSSAEQHYDVPEGGSTSANFELEN